MYADMTCPSVRMSLSAGRLRRIDAVDRRPRCDTGFHDVRPALTPADCLVRNGGKFVFGRMWSHDIDQYMVRHKVLVRAEHAGLLLKSGNDLLP